MRWFEMEGGVPLEQELMFARATLAAFVSDLPSQPRRHLANEFYTLQP